MSSIFDITSGGLETKSAARMYKHPRRVDQLSSHMFGNDAGRFSVGRADSDIKAMTATANGYRSFDGFTFNHKSTSYPRFRRAIKARLIAMQ